MALMAQVKDITTERALREIATRGTTDAYDYLCSRFPPKVVHRKWEQLIARGLMDYGVSVRGAYLTAAGRDQCAAREG